MPEGTAKTESLGAAIAKESAAAAGAVTLAYGLAEFTYGDRPVLGIAACLTGYVLGRRFVEWDEPKTPSPGQQ